MVQGNSKLWFEDLVITSDGYKFLEQDESNPEITIKMFVAKAKYTLLDFLNSQSEEEKTRIQMELNAKETDSKNNKKEWYNNSYFHTDIYYQIGFLFIKMVTK